MLYRLWPSKICILVLNWSCWIQITGDALRPYGGRCVYNKKALISGLENYLHTISVMIMSEDMECDLISI